MHSKEARKLFFNMFLFYLQFTQWPENGILNKFQFNELKALMRNQTRQGIHSAN